eukprot:scaffold339070_cov59-Attheya_sp.AAC.1
MAKKSGGKPTKNKGAKGKKARAKVKLDRRWGETVNEDELKAARIRKGRSRLHTDGVSGKKEIRKNIVNRQDETFSSAQHANNISSDEDSDLDEPGNISSTNPLDALLKKIGRTDEISDTNELTTEEDQSDEEADDENESDCPDVDIETADNQQDNHVASDDEGDSTEDPFTSHFSKDLLPEDQSALESEIPSVQKLSTISAPCLDTSFEMRLSGPSLDRASLFAGKPNASLKSKWENLTMNHYRRIRKVLECNWAVYNKDVVSRSGKEKKKSLTCLMSPLQSTIYPTLATYGDVLLTTESRKEIDISLDLTD